VPRTTPQHRALQDVGWYHLLQGTPKWHLRTAISFRSYCALLHTPSPSWYGYCSRSRLPYSEWGQHDHNRWPRTRPKISATYLVTYSDKISLNGTWFVNQLGSSMKKPAVSAITVVNITTHQSRLSLPFLHELSLSNLHHTGTLREELTLASFLSFSFALLASFLLCSTVWLDYHVLRTRRHGKPGTNGDVEWAGHRDGDHGSHEEKLSRCRPARAVRKLPTLHTGDHRPKSEHKHSRSKWSSLPRY